MVAFISVIETITERSTSMLKKFKYFVPVLLIAAMVLALATTAQAKKGGQVIGVVNVNSATSEELTMVPGIGPAKATAIIQVREHEKFSSVQDLTKVKGIGEKLLAKIQAYVTVDDPTTAKLIKDNSLNLDTATEGEQG